MSPALKEQKVALVTGATRGIGRVIAEALGEAGFAVVVTGRTMAAGQGQHDGMGVPVAGSVEETVARIVEGGGVALGLRLDLLDRASIDSALAATVDRFGRLDVLVNNGIYQGPAVRQKVIEISMDEAERSIQGNFLNQFYLSQRALHIMLRQGGGRMLFMSTLSSVQPTVGSSGLFYNAPKAALNRIPDYINFEHGKDGISAFLIEPQFTMTDTLRAILGDDAEKVGFGLVPYDPIETARTVAWLAGHPDAPAYAGADIINAPEFFRDNGINPDDLPNASVAS
jgi:NAD(P)-dependent dehydrogenase (short-subunit alcohol dehydrogenase family)